MAGLDLEEARNKLEESEKAKADKRAEIKRLYDSLTQNKEILDLLMLQIGKDIEARFPNVKFMLISRIKTEKSLSDKLENDLSGITDVKKIKELDIFDIIALSIIIESVPDEIHTGDTSFDDHIAELIQIRNESKNNIKINQEQYNGYQKRIDCFKERKEEKLCQEKENDEMLSNISQDSEDKYGMKDYLMKISKSLKSDIEDIDEQIKNMETDMANMKLIVSRTKDRYAKESNECNHTLADFIIKNLSKFDNVKEMELSDIPKRFKQKENYDGYKAVHNCYELNVKFKDVNGEEKNVEFRCEIQGKSIDAFYIADRGKAARYHTNQKEEPGKRVKRKKLPNSLEIQTSQDIDEFREEIRRTVPEYRIYRHSKSKTGVDENNLNQPDVYTLSPKEAFVLYYSNQLLGNDKLGINASPEILDDIVSSSKLSGNGRIYKDYKYVEVEER